MSLSIALSASVAGLRAQSAALATVSENIANASTTAYKTREISFQSLVTNRNTASSLNQVGGSVTYSTNQDMTQQGSIENTGVTTNLAISGSGFFVVTDDPNNQPSGYQYTRNGNFSLNEDGLLINDEGMILLGQVTDDNGNVTAANANDLNSLVPTDLNSISGTAQSTSLVQFSMNLPADAAVYDPLDPDTSTYTTAYEFFDELGVSHTVEMTWTKTAANTWTVDFADPYQSSLGSGSGTTGSIDVDPSTAALDTQLTVVFNGDGSIATINGNAADKFDVSVTGLTTGAYDVNYSIDFGKAGGYDGLTQYSSNDDTPGIEISSIEQDGVRYGQFSGVEISDDGLVTALFDNGVRKSIYQIPIATFSNPSGLTNVHGTVYDENENAGNYVLNKPGDGSAGTIEPTSLELSSTDTSEEFDKMIVAQQAYSSAAQVLTTVKDMFDTLINSVR